MPEMLPDPYKRYVSNTAYLKARPTYEPAVSLRGGGPVAHDQKFPAESSGSSDSQGHSANSGTYEDTYGRNISEDIPQTSNMAFQSILPDNPFGVICEAPKAPITEPNKPRYMPILQFWTWRTELHVALRGTTTSKLFESGGTGLAMCDVLDRDGDWCGCVVLNREWISERLGHAFSFIAISDAREFTPDECPVWTYYIPKAREESQWDVYFVLLLERNVEMGVWERAGLGKVFQAAFREKSWAEIKLG